MPEQTKVVGEVFEFMELNGRTVMYVDLPVGSKFNEGDKVEITLTKKEDVA
jgi:hypothetical protein